MRNGRAAAPSLTPEAILFDLDGVLADVSRSYREAIRATAATYGVELSAADIATRKAAGNANDDWVVTTELIAGAGRSVPLREVTERFEELYQGTERDSGLRELESLTVPVEWLASLAARLPLAIVTGRPRADAERFLNRFAIRQFFSAVVTREDGPLKPNPAPVQLALSQLGIQRAWFLGDTPDDVVSALAAAVIPIGVVAPGEPDVNSARATLLRAGAARVLNSPMELEECLH